MSDGTRVSKMSGAGNDFIVLESGQAEGLPGGTVAWVRRVCRRGVSVGADGVLFVGARGPGSVEVRFLNPDGSEAFCGNGARCAARFAHHRGLAGAEMILLTAAGELQATVRGDGVRIVLPPPEDRGRLALEVAGEELGGRWIVAGVPHFVVFVAAVAGDALSRWGPVVRRHPHFGPPGTNLDLVERRPDGVLALRTWERGVEGETLACGSGAVAAAWAARLAGGPERSELLVASGFRLTVELPGASDAPTSATLAGDARLIWEGEIGLEAIAGLPAS